MSLALALLSVVVSVGTVIGYASLLGVPAVRNHPEGYVAAFAIAATIAGLAVALRRRWPAWVALGVALVLLAGGGYVNFVMARIPPAPTMVRVGERAADFTLPDAMGRPISRRDFRGHKPVVLVFYRGHW